MRTCEAREIGRLEGPGSGRSSGLPPRTLFFPPSPKTMGPESARVLKSYYVPTHLVLGAETEGQGPFLPRFLSLSEGSPGIFFVPETPPRELSAFSPTAKHGGFREPCFGEMRRLGNRESRQRTDGRQITDDKKRGKRKDDGRRKKKRDGGGNRYI